MEKAKIFIVEDEAIIAMEIENQLQSLGYEVSSIVDTGEKAIKKAEEDKPDLILMDIRIKGEMDGIEAAEEIRNRFSIPVIFSTAYLDEERIERAKITMPFGYVLKPIQERDLRVTIEMALYVAKVDAERRSAKQELNEQIIFLDSIVEQSNFAMWISDTKGTMIKSNKKLRQTLNLSNDQLIGKYNVFSDNNLSKEQLVAIREVFEQNRPIKLELFWEGANVDKVYFKDSFDIWVEASFFPVVDKSGSLKNVVCQWIDITEHKQAEEALKKSKEWFSTTLRSIGDAVITTDTNGNITLLNPVAELLTGWTQKDANGKPLKEIFKIINETTREQVGNPVEKVLTTGNIVGLANHTILIAKDGKEIPIDDSGSPIKNDKGEVFGVVLVFREIAKNK